MSLAGPPPVRRLGVDDLEQLVRLETSAHPLPWTDDQLLLEIVHADSVLLAIDGAAGPEAYIALRKMLDELWILNLAVAPGSRRKGYASGLLAVAEGEARFRGCASLWLEVRESNGGARALYQGAGFAEVGRRPAYYRPLPGENAREAAVLMRKSVGQRTTDVANARRSSPG